MMMDTITDQPQRQIVAELIREKALALPWNEEIPHGIAVSIERMKDRKGQNRSMDIDATIICERDSHKGIIIGKGGAMLKKIGTNARYEIERLLGCKVNLKLWVKVKKDWRDSDFRRLRTSAMTRRKYSFYCGPESDELGMSERLEGKRDGAQGGSLRRI